MGESNRILLNILHEVLNTLEQQQNESKKKLQRCQKEMEMLHQENVGAQEKKAVASYAHAKTQEQYQTLLDYLYRLPEKERISVLMEKMNTLHKEEEHLRDTLCLVEEIAKTKEQQKQESEFSLAVCEEEYKRQLKEQREILEQIQKMSK